MKEATREIPKYRQLVRQYCHDADGQPCPTLDIASQGDPAVPWAFQLDLPEEEFRLYANGNPPAGPIQLRGHAQSLQIEGDSISCVVASHILEDFEHWEPVLREWVRVLKPGGKLVILVPDKALWKAALDRGQPPNCEHRHEACVGELSTYADKLGLGVIEDRLTNLFEGDYTILFVAQKL
jgi:SAM-dependent methyltransferase